jgi:hypothetical protein
MMFVRGKAGLGPTLLSPSIDRIIPSCGYQQWNSRFILLGVNSLKGSGSDDEMYAVAQALTLNKSSSLPRKGVRHG